MGFEYESEGVSCEGDPFFAPVVLFNAYVSLVSMCCLFCFFFMLCVGILGSFGDDNGSFA